jgi:hypothetical protein
MPRRGSYKKKRIIMLLQQGETSAVIIANKVGCSSSYANIVKSGFLRSQKA